MIYNKFAVGLRGNRVVILNRQATSVDGLTREGAVCLIAWLYVMAGALPGAKPITESEINIAIGEDVVSGG